jgi:hypothetical protein
MTQPPTTLALFILLRLLQKSQDAVSAFVESALVYLSVLPSLERGEGRRGGSFERGEGYIERMDGAERSVGKGSSICKLLSACQYSLADLIRVLHRQ